MAGAILTAEMVAGLSAGLREIARRPLEFCPGFPEIAGRWEAWWRFEADRPLLVASAPLAAPGLRRDKAFELHGDPGAWLELRRRQMAATHYVGEAVPFVRADVGPVAMAAFLGAAIHFSREQDTSWHEPIIEEWAGRPRLVLREENAIFRRVMRLMEAIAADAAGRYLACMPDMTGAVDTLANLRGSERLCLDLVDDPGPFHEALGEVLDAWEYAHAAIYSAAVGRGAGLVQWLGCWSNVPYIVPTCDFNALIGEEDFRRHCLPSLVEQARRCGRCCFHLDGPLAARHGRALAEEPAITAIQYTPGAGTPSAVAKIPLLKMIQAHGKPVLVITPAAEVGAVVEALDRRGLAILVDEAMTVEQAEGLAKRARG